MDWDTYFLNMVELVASKSESRGKKVGAVIVGPDNEIRSTGYNGLARGVKDLDERHLKPDRFLWVEHAERNAIYNAARCGIPLKGCRIYTGYYPCADCARAIIQVGIVEIVFKVIDPSAWANWEHNIDVAKEMLTEAKIWIRVL